MSRYPLGQRRLVLERMLMWETRGMAAMSLLGVVLLNLEQGNWEYIILCIIAGCFLVVVGLLDYKFCVGQENSDILSRSPEFQELKRDIKSLLEVKK